MSCGCTDTTPCGTPDCGCKFEVDAGCVRYTGESLGATDIVEGDTLDTILKTLNTKFEEYGPGDYVELEDEAPGSNCTYGGVKIILRDGDDDSIKATKYICGVDATATLDGSGTANTITMWTPDGDSLGNSIITQSGTVITVGGTLKITGGTPGAGKVLKSDSLGEGSWSALTASDVSGVLKQDGTTPLTGSWNAGVFNITANTFIGALSGNATTATSLQSVRTINGVAFDGTANITVTAAAGTLTGTTLNATVVSSSLTSVGTIGTGVWNGTPIGDSYLASTFVKVNGTVGLSANWNAGAFGITANTFTANNDATVNGLTVGKGGASVIDNTALGIGALLDNTALGSKNTGIGSFALRSNTLGVDNTALGFGALYSNLTGSQNVGIGTSAMYYSTGGDKNTAVGGYSLLYNTGSFNTVLGYAAVGSTTITTGEYNTAVGHYAGFKLVGGDYNVLLGTEAASELIGGDYNIVLGYRAGNFLADGTTGNTTPINNVLLGANIKASTTTDTNQIVIGYGALGRGSNTTTIGNADTTNTYIYGDLNLPDTNTAVTTAVVAQAAHIPITINGTTYKLLLAL